MFQLRVLRIESAKISRQSHISKQTLVRPFFLNMLSETRRRATFKKNHLDECSVCWLALIMLVDFVKT